MNASGTPEAFRRERAGRIAFVLWVILALNWLVALAKLAVGLATRSMTLIADGLHSFSDGTSNIVGLVAVRAAGHPADPKHPYGRQKYETVASNFIAFLLVLLAFEISRSAIEGFVRPHVPMVTPLCFGITIGTLLVNVGVVLYERKKAKELRSEFLASDAWHTLTDVFVTISVLVALVGIRLGLPWLDSVFALGISAVILYTAFMILKRSVDVLVDKAVIDTRQIERIVRSIEGVRDCHEIRTRGKADDAYVDLHVLVDNDMTVLESHRVANVIEARIRKEIGGVNDVVVHVEPVSHDHHGLGEGVH